MHGEDRRRIMVAEARVKQLEDGIDYLIAIYDDAAAKALCRGSATETHIWQAVVRDVKRLKKSEIEKLDHHEGGMCYCGQACAQHSELENHAAVSMDAPLSVKEYLLSATTMLRKVEDANVYCVLADVINAIRQLVHESSNSAK